MSLQTFKCLKPKSGVASRSRQEKIVARRATAPPRGQLTKDRDSYARAIHWTQNLITCTRPSAATQHDVLNLTAAPLDASTMTTTMVSPGATPAAPAAPPSTMSSRVLKDMSVIASYPVLLSQEEQMVKTPFDAMGWYLYLQQIDDLLETLNEAASSKKKNKSVPLGGRTDIVVADIPSRRKELIKIRIHVAQRAGSLLPGSYKLWRFHLDFLTRHHKTSALIRRSFEDCLVRLHKMPRLWIAYLQYYMKQHSHKVTDIRRLYNRALEALPVTQHDKIWPLYIEWLTQGLSKDDEEDDSTQSPQQQQQQQRHEIMEIPAETIIRVMRRHAHCFDPSARERLAQVCMQLQRYGEASLLLLELLNDPNAVTEASRHDLWMTLANLCTKHATETRRVGIDFEALVRGALQPPKLQGYSIIVEQDKDDDTAAPSQQEQQQMQLGEMEGTLWNKLADYYVRQGEFEMARSIYEEALESVSRVRDFSILFDAYVQLEEGVVEAMMELQEEDDDEQETEQEHDNDDWDIFLQTNNESSDIELALARAEHLTSRRPLLLNRVLLRQNPHNVGEWLRRSELYAAQEQSELAAAALEEALITVQARKAVNGMPSQLVLKLAKLYDTEKARDLFDRICNQHAYVFKEVDDLAQCHAAWVELELAQEQWDKALSLARRSVAAPDPSLEGPVARVARGLPKSLRLWDLLLDLEESLGTVATTKDSYNRAIELKVATPMHVINFASFLTDQKYFEESFTAYERGVELFPFPHAGAKLLWKNYLTAFLKRYGGSKMERTRDLFQRCLEACPAEESSEFFMLQGKFEEEHGLTKRALGVYRAMCQKVPPEEKYAAYQLFIAKTIQYMGVPATRDIYQEAVTSLPDRPAAQMCLDFAKMETSIHEVDRARAVLAYGAQLADPRRFPEYWSRWHEFEVAHGNEETFREMLRIKRSVQAAFSTVNYNAAGMDAGNENLTNEEAMHMIADREGVELVPEKKTAVQGFVPGKRKAEAVHLDEVEDRVAKLRKATAGVGETQHVQAEDEEIDLDDLDDEEEGEADSSKANTPSVRDVATKPIPSAVFGGLASKSRSEENMGALERLRAAAADKAKGGSSQ